MHSTMTRKGQVTIPAALRHSFGFREGAAVEFFSTDTFVGVRPVQPSTNASKVEDKVAVQAATNAAPMMVARLVNMVFSF